MLRPGLLTRWNHSDLRAKKVTMKFWTKEPKCQASNGALALKRFNCLRLLYAAALMWNRLDFHILVKEFV